MYYQQISNWNQKNGTYIPVFQTLSTKCTLHFGVNEYTSFALEVVYSTKTPER